MKKILIVEDEPILYAKLERLLKSEYELYDFTPSVAVALEHINKKRPDLVLLDIDLEGALSGRDLGAKLSDHFRIPFIYVTHHGDLDTFYKSLNTKPEQYVVKTKPVLNKVELLNAIRTALYKQDQIKDIQITPALGLEVIEDYKEKLQRLKNEHAKRREFIRFEEIALISNKDYKGDNLQKGYSAIVTTTRDTYYYAGYLNKVYDKLPEEKFLRVNDSEIVNVDVLTGRINGQNLEMQFKVPTDKPEVKKLVLNRTYQERVRKRLAELFGR